MADTQTFENHTRYFPLFHFFASPILYANAMFWTYKLVQTPNVNLAWQALVAWGLAAGLLCARVMALRTQDRIIRLEETLRMQRVLPAELQGEVAKLRPGQLVALRFASDAELPGLMRRTLAGEFAKPVDIKKAVREWRADYLRA